MIRSDIAVMPEYFDRYITLVDNIELSDAFKQSVERLDAMDLQRLRLLGSRTYAPGKWTLNDILQHLIDTERILAYRALRFARNDATPLSGFDEKDFAAEAHAVTRRLENIIAELKAVRMSTWMMYESFDDAVMHRVGINWDKEISVLAMGFNIVGHQLHHLSVVERLYLPLLMNNR